MHRGARVRQGVLSVIGLMLAAGAAQAAVNVPLGGGAAGIDGVKPVAVSGIKATVRAVANADAGKPALEVAFTKTGEERRLLSLEARPKGDPTGARTLAMRFSLKLAKGNAPRLALVAFDGDGGAWCKTAGTLAADGQFADVRLPITQLRQAGFSEDKSGELEWNKLTKVWVGLVFDGAAEGTLAVSGLRFTDEIYKPDRPHVVTGDQPGKWSVGKDPAVEATLTTPNEGPGGKACMKFEFRFPGQKHMYALPSVPVPTADLEGYRALRFKCKATLPPGLTKLLVTLAEQGGGQYFCEPAPPANGEWGVVELPIDGFKLASWSKDPNGKLDPASIGSVIIGTHGAAAGEGGPGTLWVADVEFVP